MFLEKIYHASTKEWVREHCLVRSKKKITSVGSITQERRGEPHVLFTGGKKIVCVSKRLVAGSLGRIHYVRGYNIKKFRCGPFS